MQAFALTSAMFSFEHGFYFSPKLGGSDGEDSLSFHLMSKPVFVFIPELHEENHLEAVLISSPWKSALGYWGPSRGGNTVGWG